MKNYKLIVLVAAILGGSVSMAQNHFTERDTIDVLHYNICLDMGHHQPQHIQGWSEVTMRLLQPTEQVSLGLEAATIDSVQVNGVGVAASAVGYDRHQLRVPVASAAEGDTLRVKVYYGSYGWQGSDGGFWCDSDKFYNLGEDRRSRPFSMGRSCLTFIIGNTREIFGKNDKELSHALILSLKRKPNVLGIGIAIFIKRWLFYP